MDLAMKERRLLRGLFTRARAKLEKKIAEQEEATAEFNFCKLKAESLFVVDQKIMDFWLETPDVDEEKILEDTVTAENYQLEWEKLKTEFERSTGRHGSGSENSPIDTVRSQHNSTCSNCQARRFQLPKIELRKFDGNVKNWIGFWGQFKKIDSDDSMDNEDKFQYLYQCTVPDSPARTLVASFPPSGDNYKKAVEQLKARFARDDLLIEIYVRELLHLVLDQAKSKVTPKLSHLYDKLKTQLQALESLGVTSDKYAALLFPLVESALPESVLRAWERSQSEWDKSDDNLNKLLLFLKREVESEERIQLARTGLSTDNDYDCLDDGKKQPTASCLLSTNDVGKKKTQELCVWCDKPHNSLECYKANRMSFEDRKELLTKKKGCMICLKSGHKSKVCTRKTKCLVCAKRHCVLMCPDLKSPSQQAGQAEMSEAQNNGSQTKMGTTLLQTLTVKIANGDYSLSVRAFIDTGAQKSYIRRDIAQKLNMKPVKRETLSHCLFGGVKTECEEHEVYEFYVHSLDNQFSLKMSALDKGKICGHIPRLSKTNEIILKLQKLGVAPIDVGEGAPAIDLLIGADYAGQLFTEQLMQLDDNITVIKTKLGWTVQGRITNVCNTVAAVNLQIAELWELETLGIKDPAEIEKKANMEATVLQELRSTIKINSEGRYEVKLPWKPGHAELLDNKPLAEKRLISTTRRLEQLNEFEGYGQIFKDWLDVGIIEETYAEQTPKHYLPHHAVIKETSQTTRVRPVFDASARDFNGNSLNSFLEKGVNCLEQIPILLTKFRRNAIGVTSDIKKAFLQISLREEDRKYLSFLWWKDSEKKALITYRHCRVVFGITSSPFLLGATINYHLERYTDKYKNTAERLIKSFYVDNCVTSLETVEETQLFIEDAKKIMLDGKFELRGWVTAPMTNEEMTGNEENLSVLGVTWRLKTDELHCGVSVREIHMNEKVSKRTLLSITQSIFDPIGVTCPVTLIPKLLLQKTWALNIGWDAKLPDDLQDEFGAWHKHVHLLNKCQVPRRLTIESIDTCQNSIHVFCDASKLSFAAAIFLRSEKVGRVSVRLVLAKTRVAPIREVTIPRLELMAALIATRLYTQAKHALELDNCKSYFWTDSSVALTWITTDGDWSIFVKNRVKEIRETTNTDDWRHLPGSMNPADLPSRGCNAKTLLSSKWWEGPAWLRRKESDWPISFELGDKSDVDTERQKRLIVSNVTETTTFLSTLTYFSKYRMIVRLVAWILRFKYNSRNFSRKLKGEITGEEYGIAEKRLLKLIQNESIETVDTKNLRTFTDPEGIIRIKTKLVLGDEPTTFTMPILLPGKHPIVVRLIADKHRLLNHAGSNTLITNLRETYWITGVRRLVKTAISKCLACKRETAKPAEAPTAPLPKDRMKPAAAFEVTGIDLAGPLFLLSGGKVWIVIFTCAVYRAIHLELTKSLSTESFLMALRRFIARRGRVDVIYTDNGTNFHGAANQLSSLNWNEITAFSSIQNIKWKFNPPAAPWWGGWWERLVRSVKELLRRNLGQKTVNYVELETILCDCESVINSRPLTYITEDTEKLKPLTPAHFLQGIPRGEVTDLDLADRDSLNRRLRYLYKLREDLRERFRKEYLAMLVQKGKEKGCILEVGEVVLLETEAKRIKWPIGIIIETHRGRDGHVRAATVRTQEGAVYLRPIQRLYPLELRDANWATNNGR